MAAEQILQVNQPDNEVRMALTKKCRNIEDKVSELRGLIATLNLAFTGESMDDSDITDLYYATLVIKNRFNELAEVLGYGAERD